MEIRRTNIGEIYYYHPNHLSSTMYVTDAQQSVVQSFLYAPYGEIISEYNTHVMGEAFPKYSFNAKELDEETGMYYYEARYYAPPTFISRDPLMSEKPWLTPYHYCSNNPVGRVDPNGMMDDGYQDGNGNYQWFDDHSESSFTENGITWNRVTGNKKDWDEATTIRNAVMEGLISLGYNKDDVKKDVSLYPESSNLFTKEAHLNNYKKYTNGWSQSFNSETKEKDALLSGKISTTPIHLKYYSYKGEERDAIGIVKSGLSHWGEALGEAFEGIVCKIAGWDSKNDPITDMHYENAVSLLRSLHNKVDSTTPSQSKASWIESVYWKTGGMK